MTKPVKCVVWDLDDSIWKGMLLEGDRLILRCGVADILSTLDGRGVLNSIASRSDHDLAWRRLTDFGPADWFLAPQINFGSKPRSLEWIATELNIGLDSLLYVAEDPLELEMVGTDLPEVRVLDSALVHTLVDRPDTNPGLSSRGPGSQVDVPGEPTAHRGGGELRRARGGTARLVAHSVHDSPSRAGRPGIVCIPPPRLTRHQVTRSNQARHRRV
jgi:hypothetical protein